MGLRDWLGLSAPRDAGPEPTEVVERIGASLPGLSPERTRLLGAFAYLLGRVAHADHELTAEEVAAMQAVVVEEGGLGLDQARAVVATAQQQSRLYRGTEDFRVAQEFAALATPDEKLALLRCLFAVSAADAAVVLAEDNEIRRITQELKIPHEDFIRARLAVRDRLAVLRKA
jgi:uncharacterized tellurite resistance protein B-like protein